MGGLTRDAPPVGRLPHRVTGASLVALFWCAMFCSAALKCTALGCPALPSHAALLVASPGSSRSGHDPRSGELMIALPF
jgi:hypothetical protein